MKTMAKLSLIMVVLLSILLVFGGISTADEHMMGQHQTVHNFADASVIEGAEAVLHRMDHGVQMTLDTSGLTEGNAVTVWWVIFNAPENCSDMACGEDDIFNIDDDGEFILNDDGSNPMNMDGIGGAQISALRADGHVIDEGGAAFFQAHLPIGDTTEAIFGSGLLDSSTVAEIHLVVRDHGAAIPGETDAMINSINGGCADSWPNEPCTDVQFAVFAPPDGDGM